ncbi:hypothetical protein [Aeoliella mucimassa]|uniref:DUF4878 domain-containing protein n=1 Tax=Aeoliella mucimassa TaxID=2527972 RepID=A0A518AUY7_9BACT|nr:hypothetical protein [Aeoliella mucimassa]QDU58528.1 hypothetical protein Pan181_47660 [Aeoliella mucimassa]
MRCLCALVSLTFVTALGCGGGDTASNAPSTGGTATSASASASDINKHPAVVSSTKFLKAISTGDQTTAMGCLTPLAAKQLEDYGQGFKFAAVAEADFKATNLRENAMDTDETAVEYHMTVSDGTESVELDLCCIMRQVNNDWRLSGIVYDLGNGQEPVLVNYEAAPQQPANTANSAQTAANSGAEAAAAETAQAPAGAQNR